MIEHELSMCKALGSNPTTKTKVQVDKKGKTLYLGEVGEKRLVRRSIQETMVCGKGGKRAGTGRPVTNCRRRPHAGSGGKH